MIRKLIGYLIIALGAYTLWAEYNLPFSPVGNWANRPYSFFVGFLTVVCFVATMVLYVRKGGQLIDEDAVSSVRHVLRSIGLLVASPFVVYLSLLAVMDSLALLYTKALGSEVSRVMVVEFEEKRGRRNGWCPRSINVGGSSIHGLQGRICLSKQKFTELREVFRVNDLNGLRFSFAMSGKESSFGLYIESARVTRSGGEEYFVLPDNLGWL